MTRRTKLAAAAITLCGIGATVLWAAAPGSVASAAQSAVQSASPTAPGCPIRKLIMSHIARFMGLRAELGITDEQRAKIKEVLVGHKKEIAQAALDIVNKRRALREAVLADSPDEAAIRAASDELGKAIGNAAVLGSKIVPEVRPILIPTQIEMIKKFRADSATQTDNFLQGILGQP